MKIFSRQTIFFCVVVCAKNFFVFVIIMIIIIIITIIIIIIIIIHIYCIYLYMVKIHKVILCSKNTNLSITA